VGGRARGPGDSGDDAAAASRQRNGESEKDEARAGERRDGERNGDAAAAVPRLRDSDRERPRGFSRGAATVGNAVCGGSGHNPGGAGADAFVPNENTDGCAPATSAFAARVAAATTAAASEGASNRASNAPLCR
jgi:hypothetical protein